MAGPSHSLAGTAYFVYTNALRGSLPGRIAVL